MIKSSSNYPALQQSISGIYSISNKLFVGSLIFAGVVVSLLLFLWMNAGIDINTISIRNWPKISNFDIPNDSNTAISFFLAFIHNNNNNETTTPANINEPANNLFEIE